ncbi:MAG: glycosyltransferase family 9 protein [Candidatus Firestonebacteria bacterium]
MHISVLRKLWWQSLTLIAIFIIRIFFRRDKKNIPADVLSKKFKNILVIRIDRIGDMLLATPVFRTIKKVYPDSKLIVFASSYNKNVIEGNPYVDKVLVHSGILSSLNTLEVEKFDLAIDLFCGFNLKSALLCCLSNAEIKLGYKSKFSKHFFDFEVEPVKESQYEAISNLKLLGPFGIKTNDIKLDVYPVESNKKKNLNQKIIGINIGTRRKVHRWSYENFAALADKIIEKFNAQVIITWGPGELDLAKKTLASMKNGDGLLVASHCHKAVLAPGTDARQLASLLNSFDLFICGDTGPFHIAVAMDIPVIAIFGKSDYIRWSPPFSKINVVADSSAISLPINRQLQSDIRIIAGKRCNEITVDEVFSEVCEVLNAK